MIDISKMKALAAHLRAHDERHHLTQNTTDHRAAATAIDSLLSELEASNQKRKEAVMDAERAREERNREHVKLNAEWIEKTAALRAELEAREADRRDAEIHRYMREKFWISIFEEESAVAALAQRQEGEEK